MARVLWMKIAAIAALALFLLVPLSLIEYKITERQATRAAVVAELANTSVGEQTLSGPLLVLPCTEHYFSEEREGGDGTVKRKRTRDCTRSYVPDRLTITGNLTTENRYRGIYAARFFIAILQFEGRFDVPVATGGGTREYGAPLLTVAIKDARGVRSAPSLSWNGTTLPFKPGVRPDVIGTGVHAIVGGAAAPPSGAQKFSFALEIMGLQSLNLVPSAKQEEVQLSADWAHPSFVGRHLPATREIDASGFKAVWRTSELSSEAPRTLAICGDPACPGVAQLHFGVSLIDPVDVYVQANRAIKYALLFVLLTFAVFFLFEIMRELRIHPIQYALVGLALAMFFLLLIALSEHVRFLYAYAISAGACISLIAVYVKSVLQSVLRALGFGAMLTALYTMLYALLRSEDQSLLLGALLVFGVLAAVMLMTRKVDWYTVGARSAESTTVRSEPAPSEVEG